MRGDGSNQLKILAALPLRETYELRQRPVISILMDSYYNGFEFIKLGNFFYEGDSNNRIGNIGRFF